MASQSRSYKRLDSAVRYTFRYEGAEVTLADRQYLEKAVPASGRSKGYEGGEKRSGFWIELQDQEGRTLHRKVMHNPIRFHAEVTTQGGEQGKGGSFTNVRIENPKGTFFAILPNLPEAKALVIFSSPLGHEAVPGPAEPIARFDPRGVEEES